MKVIEYINRINLIDELIRERSTGKPEVLARKLKISKSRLFQLIEELRFMNIPIAYSRRLETYFYKVDFKVTANITIKELTDEELKNTNGGHYINFFIHSNFISV